MVIDALLTRFFQALALALIAVAAYLQASGAMRLLGAGFATPVGASPAALGTAARGVSTREKSAEPILTRNVFDSTTGPLNREKPAIAKPSADFSDPLSAPSCDGMRVAIVTESADPEWSAVALRAPFDVSPKLYRVGDEVSGKKIAFIGYNPRRNSPAVWITGDASLCQTLLLVEPPAVPLPAAVGATVAPLAAEITSRIRKVSDREFDVDRAVVDEILENQAELMRRTRIVPEQKDGKVIGIRLFGIAPDSLLGKLGLMNGDRLESINGFDVASPEKALEAYARLRTASLLTVKISRGGATQSLDYRIK